MRLPLPVLLACLPLLLLLAACRDSGSGGGSAEGEGEGPPTEGEGEGPPTEGEGEGPPTEGEGEGPPTEGEGEGPPTEGEGEGPTLDWSPDTLLWAGRLWPVEDDAAERDVDLIVTRRTPDNQVEPLGPGDVVDGCTVADETGADGGGVCRVGPEDLRIDPVRLVDPGGMCSEPEGCIYPVEADVSLVSMGFVPGAAPGRRVLAVVVDHSGRMDGVGPGGAVEPARAADPSNRRVAAVADLLWDLDPGDRAALFTFGGTGAQGLRNRVEEACDTCDGFAPPDQAAATADTLFPAANVTEAPMWDALARAVDDARAYAGTYGGSPAVVLLTAGDDLGSAAGSADVALMTVGPPRVPILAVHLDRPAALEAVHDRLAPLEDLAWASEGTYARMETADDLPQALDLARLATGPRLRLTIDLAAALTDPGPPPGSLARIELDFVLTLAGMDLGLGGARLPVLIR